MLAAMSEKGGFRAGLDAGRRAAQEPVAVRRRKQPEQAGEAQRRRRDRPPLAAFGVMAIAIVLILGNNFFQKALGFSGPTPEVAGVFLSAVSVLMLRPPRRK